MAIGQGNGAGRPRTPTAILKASGSWRAAGRKKEPQARVAIPVCPSWVENTQAKKLFKKLARQLAGIGVMTNIDQTSLAMTCAAFGTFVESNEIIKLEGTVAFGKNGQPYIHPAVGTRSMAWKMVMQGCREFGLTPSSRAGITVGAQPAADKKDEEFFGLTGT